MDDLTPPGNLPMPVKTDKAPPPKPAPRPPVRDKEKVKQDSATKKYSGGGPTSSASKRADGCATKGKTRGKFV
jgi:hypothetical protein